MMIHFRRNALRVTVAALLSSAFGAQAADIPQVKVTVNDKQCEPMQVTVNAGKTQFIIQNHSQKALEWEILKGVMVVEERENIAPGFTQKLTANLQPGEYDMTCGLLTNPKGKLIVTGAATKDAAKADAVLSLGDAITAYKAYVTAETAQLVSGTKAFTDAVKAGDIEKAKALYAPTRQHYERIEPIAELFSDLDGSIDAREDDFEKKAEDPKFTGFHRLEKALFGDNSVKGMEKYADQLNSDVLAADKADLERLFRLLTQRIAFLTQGGPAPDTPNPRLPPMDSGILGPWIAPDNLTITVSVGHSLFDERFGLADKAPKKLQPMTRFPNDSLDAALCHGDLLLQICANTQDTVIHALRDVIKHTPDLLSVRWKREGFISDSAARSKGKETPINLLGFKDGTANPASHDSALMDKVVWVTADQDEPAWTVGGSYQAARIIQFHVEFWDRTPLKEQQTIFGRDKHTGAPLGMKNEHDTPDYSKDPNGEVIALDSHIRLANPRTPETQSSLMMRRGYSYSLGVTNAGQLDMGLLFVCYQHDLEKGFLTVQKRLNGEALEEYVKPIGGGYFFVLPGVVDDKHYLGESLLQA